MAVSVTNIGTTSNTSGAVLSLSAVTVPAGSLIFVATVEAAANGAGSLADAVNTYANPAGGLHNNTASTGWGAGYYAANASLTSGTITFTKNVSGHGACLSALYATGIVAVSPLDSAVTATSFGTGTAPSVTSGTPSRVGELFIAVETAASTETYTQDTTHNWVTPPNAISAASAHSIGGGSQVNAGKAAIIFSPTINTSAGWNAFVLGFFAQAPLVSRPWHRARIPDPPPPWGAAPLGSDTIFQLTAGGRPKNKQLWRYDLVPDPVWLADSTPTNIRTFPAAAALPSPVVVPHTREDTNWTWGPQPSDTLYLLTSGGKPFAKQWRYDHVPDPPWLWEAPPDWTLLLPLTSVAGPPQTQFWAPNPPLQICWQWDPPYNIELLFPTAAAPFSKQWRYDYVPDPVWLGAPATANIEALPAAPTLLGASGVILDVQFDSIWIGTPVAVNIGTLSPPTAVVSLPAPVVVMHGLSETWWQGTPVGTNIGTIPAPVVVAGPPQTQFWAPSPPLRTEWQWSPPYNVELLSPAAPQPFSRFWRWDQVSEPSWDASPRRSYTLFDLTGGGKPFSRQWRWDHVPDPAWRASPLKASYAALKESGQPFNTEWAAQYAYVPERIWQGQPFSLFIRFLPPRIDTDQITDTIVLPKPIDAILEGDQFYEFSHRTWDVRDVNPQYKVQVSAGSVKKLSEDEPTFRVRTDKKGYD